MSSLSTPPPMLPTDINTLPVSLEIIVRTVEGEDYTFQAISTSTLLQLRQHIATRTSIPIERQRLLRHGRFFSSSDNERTLSQLQFEPRTVIHLVQQPASVVPSGRSPSPARRQSTSEAPPPALQPWFERAQALERRLALQPSSVDQEELRRCLQDPTLYFQAAFLLTRRFQALRSFMDETYLQPISSGWQTTSLEPRHLNEKVAMVTTLMPALLEWDRFLHQLIRVSVFTQQGPHWDVEAARPLGPQQAPGVPPAGHSAVAAMRAGPVPVEIIPLEVSQVQRGPLQSTTTTTTTTAELPQVMGQALSAILGRVFAPQPSASPEQQNQQPTSPQEDLD